MILRSGARVHMVPFLVSFVKCEPRADNERAADLDLDKKLEAEASGILAWLVRGCIDWQEQGLNPPDIVTDATREYRRREDTLADFLDECCDLDPDARINSTTIYTLFRKWWAKNVSAGWIPSQRRFGDWMTLKFDKISKPTVTYLGVDIKHDAASQYYDE